MIEIVVDSVGRAGLAPLAPPHARYIGSLLDDGTIVLEPATDVLLDWVRGATTEVAHSVP